jgi:serine protease Do
MKLVPLSAALLLTLGAAPCFAQQPLTAAAEAVNRKMVKLYGIGGFKGLPSYGTGILVSANGHILTVNNHILNTPDVIVHLYDGRQFRAQVVAKEPELDVALLKIDDKVMGLPHFNFAEAAARPLATQGDWVMAFSNQFNIATRDEPMSVQHGVVAAYTELRGRRGIFEAPFSGHVYFVDVVANNPGAAGGIITTRRGDLLGIIGRELKNSLSDSWINYAVPIQAKAEVVLDDMPRTVDMAAFVREAMDGKYRQSTKKKDKLLAGAYHGIILVPNVVSLTPPYVEDVVGGSPAAKAGLQADDLIVYIEGDLVSSIKMFRDLIKSYPAGTPLRFEVQRGSRLVSLTMTMVEQPKKKT